ncbi:hypothetical protein [Haloferax sp. Atlit-24N]|uniref:hypothetical protein n=1 Tax=Haloferax sp. Atlit-24N TaxID=2077200 RepID=UPI0018F4E809|nr:hypothetical protein [Haloferax sp. Atlit-24N]
MQILLVRVFPLSWNVAEALDLDGLLTEETEENLFGNAYTGLLGQQTLERLTGILDGYGIVIAHRCAPGYPRFRI